MELKLIGFEKLHILMHEYDALSDQLVQRFIGQMIIYFVLSALLTGAIISITFHADVVFIVLIVVCVAWIWLWVDIDRDIAKAALRMRRIESTVNNIAGTSLLEWETKWGRGGVVGKHLLPKEIG